MKKKELIFAPELGVLNVDTFSKMYPEVNNYIYSEKEYEPCRDGEVKEVLNFKTNLTNPYRRCVGGYGRDINIFFLLAEAMWIVLGKKDVKFLSIFNKNMEKFSDNGTTFHAPYGYRLRNWGISSDISETTSVSRGEDQVISAIRIFTENPNSRQVVMTIWNPSLDLGAVSKDIPCNDMIMLKIRDGKLITTIQNRSNDLHWGLPTNIFQFSFLTELMSLCLGIELGTQTHNSQSLHIYDWNPIAKKMSEKWNSGEGKELYTVGAIERKIDFNFNHEVAVNRFLEIEFIMQLIVNNLLNIYEGREGKDKEIQMIFESSKYFYIIYSLLKIYLNYKHKIKILTTLSEKDDAKLTAVNEIEILESEFTKNETIDIFVLAKNFFVSKLSEKEAHEHEYLGTL